MKPLGEIQPIPKQLGRYSFDKLKIGGAKQKKTKTGQYATGEEVLSYLANDNEIVRDIRMAPNGKLQSTYIDALPNQVDAKTGTSSYGLYANSSCYWPIEF
jgi:DNA polymerase-1